MLDIHGSGPLLRFSRGFCKILQQRRCKESPGQQLTAIPVHFRETLDDVIAEFSSRGSTIDGLTKPDLAVPGVGITSLLADTSYLPKKNSGSKGKPKAASQAETLGKPPKTTITDYYVTMSGTSMATPMAAGIAALLLEQNHISTPNEVKEQLVRDAGGHVIRS